MAKIVIHREICKGCQLCLAECPRKLLGIEKNANSHGYYPVVLLEEERCTGCALCALICPDVAIEVFK